MTDFIFVDKNEVRPIDIKPGFASSMKVVAWVSAGGDWAAYMGDSNWSDAEVASNGGKLLREVAEALFPSYAIARNYRD